MRKIRRNLLRSLLGLPLLGAVGHARSVTRVSLQRSPILTLLPDPLPDLQPGDRLTLCRERLSHDPYAVALYYDDLRIGHLPPTQSHTITSLLDQGQHVDAEVYRHNHSAEPWQRLQVTLYLYP